MPLGGHTARVARVTEDVLDAVAREEGSVSGTTRWPRAASDIVVVGRHDAARVQRTRERLE
jgi:hypothetical protein